MAIHSMGGSRGGDSGSGPPEKSQFAMCLLRNTSTGPHEKQMDPWVDLLLLGGSYDPM